MKKTTKAHSPSVDQKEFDSEWDALESEILAMSDEEVAEQINRRGIAPCSREHLVEFGIVDEEPASASMSPKEVGFFVRYSVTAFERIKSYFSSWPAAAFAVVSTLALALGVQTATYTVTSSKDETHQSPAQVSSDPESSRSVVNTSADQAQTQISTEKTKKQWAVVKGINTLYAVYLNPNLSSPLLTRVESGTELVITRTVDSWFGVETDLGVGFMRSNEVVLCNVGTVATC